MIKLQNTLCKCLGKTDKLKGKQENDYNNMFKLCAIETIIPKMLFLRTSDTQWREMLIIIIYQGSRNEEEDVFSLLLSKHIHLFKQKIKIKNTPHVVCN